MIYKVTKLKDLGLNSEAVLREYILDNSPEIEADRKRPAVVLCPGGGYGMVSDREAEPVAMKFLANGYSAFILTYSVAPVKYPMQLLEVSKAIAYVRQNADEYNIHKNKILVCGFSAGGHLAASVGTMWHDKIITDNIDINYGDNKPDGMILSYPVITSGDKAHKGSFENLTGGGKELWEKMSLENQVSKKTPPAFIWHTFNDAAVSVENSLLLATAMKKYEIPLELHIFPDGVHGLSLCNKLTKMVNKHCECWMDLCLKWIEENY